MGENLIPEEPQDELDCALSDLCDKHGVDHLVAVGRRAGTLFIRGLADNPADGAMAAIIGEIIAEALLANKDRINAAGKAAAEEREDKS